MLLALDIGNTHVVCAVYNSKKWIKMTVCVPSEYVPKLSYPIKIDGNILFGINKKLILKIFSYA